MKRLLVCTCLAALAGCAKPTDSGLLVQVTVAPALKTNCVSLEVHKAGEGTLIASAVVPRPAGDGPVTFAVRQADLPAEVALQAVGYTGASCEDTATRKLTSRSALTPAKFVKNTINVTTIDLGLPDAAIDADRDGYVAVTAGGIDCDDTNPNVYPGAAQICESPIDLNCDGAVFCADAACSTNAVCMSPPDRLVFAGPAPIGLRRFDCSPAIVIESRDALGLKGTSRNEPITLTATLVGTTFFSDERCTKPVTKPEILYGKSSVTVYSKATNFGDQTLTASAARLTSATLSFTIAAQPVSSFTFMPSTLTVTAGACAEGMLSSTDGMMQPTPSPVQLTATLEAVPVTGTSFYAFDDTACTASISTLTFTGVDTVKFRIKSTRATTPAAPLQVTASASTVMANGALNVTVLPAPAAALAFTTQAPGLVVNTCSVAPVKVGVQDAFGNPATVQSDTVVTLSAMRTSGSVSAALAFATSSMCADAQPSLTATIAANTTESSPVFVRGSARATFTMTAAATQLTSGHQLATIANGAPSSIVIVTLPMTAEAGKCSPRPIILETQDTSNSRSSVQTVPLSIDVSGPDLQFFGDASCSTELTNSKLVIPVGSAEGSVYFKTNVPKRASNGGVDVTFVAAAYPSPNNTAAQKNFVDPGPPYALVWPGTTSQTTASGSCTAAAYTLEARDSVGNATSFATSQNVSLSSNEGAVTAWAGSGCAGGAPVFGAGATSVQVFALAQAARTYGLVASAGGISSAAPNATLVVTPGAYSSLVFTNPSFPANVTAGTCVQTAVERRDTNGNAVPVSSSTDFVFAGPSSVEVYGWQANCQAAISPLAGKTLAVSSGATATFWVRPTLAGSQGVTVSAGGISTAPGTFNVGSAAATQLVWVAPPGGMGGLQAGGCLVGTLERRDAFGNAVAEGAALTITLSAAGPASASAGFYGASDCSGSTTSAVTIAGGASQASFGIRSSTAGTMTVSLSSSLSANPAAIITVVAGSATQLVFTTAPGNTNITAGTCTQLTVERRDAGGNPVAFAGTFTITLPAGMTAFASAGNCMSNTGSTTLVPSGGGASGTFFVRPTVAGTVSVTINDGVFNATAAVQTVAASADHFVWSTGGATLGAGACRPITLERRDVFDNLAVGSAASVTVTLTGSASPNAVVSTSSDCSTGSVTGATVAFSGSESSKTFSVVATTAGLLTATPSGAAGVPAAVTYTVNAGTGTQLVFSGAGAPVVAGTCTTRNVLLQDMYGNATRPTATLIVTLSASPGAALFYTSANNCTNNASVTSVTIGTGATLVAVTFRANGAPTTNVRASASGVTDATQTYTVSPGAPARLGWKTAPVASLTRFACQTAEVEVLDLYGNAVPSPAAPPSRTLTLAQTGTTANLLFFASADCSGAQSTSLTLPANTGPVAFSYQAIGSGMTNVTASDGINMLTATPNAPVSVMGATGALVVTPATTSIEYFDCEAVVIKRQAAGADWSKGATVVSVASNNTAITVHTDSACTVAFSNRTIANGAASTTVYVRGHSAPSTSVTLTASDVAGGFDDGTATLTALPLVRRGSCTVAAAASSVSCTVSPAIPGDTSHSFLVFQSSIDSAVPNDATVRCALSTTSAVTCSRSGTLGAVEINWQVVSMGRSANEGGLSVQHFAPAAPLVLTSSMPVDVAISSVTMNRTVVLMSTSSSGPAIGDNDFITVRLKDATTISFAAAAAGSFSYAAQVVEIGGATVARGSATTAASGQHNVNGGVNMPIAQTVAIGSARLTATQLPSTCRRAWRLVTTNSTDITFQRGSNAGGICVDTPAELFYERVLLPAGSNVQICTAQIGGGAPTTGTCSIATATTADRTLLMMGMQGMGGQSLGETAQTADGNYGYAGARISVSAATVTATRGASSTTRSDFSPFVIEFPQ